MPGALPPIPPETPLWILAGPTAVGKSEIALTLAQELGGEIVSVDSMQVYRGMDIGTAKPSADELARVPHHLINLAEVRSPFDAAQFAQAAREAIAGIVKRGRVPILCGGTGLYFSALLHGLGEAPASDASLRAELEATPLPCLLEELAARDPAGFQRIDRQNPRRVIRAVEIIRLTGKPVAEQRARWEPGLGATRGAVLSRTPADLRQRIDQRVDHMFRAGLVSETKALLERGLAENRNAMQALGYRQVAEHLAGARSLPETSELVKIRTRQFAKRQMTWFRRYLPYPRLHLEREESAEQVVRRLVALTVAPPDKSAGPGPESNP